MIHLECDNSIQFILVGDEYIGKTKLFLSFQDKPFEDFSKETNDIDYFLKYKKIKGEQFELKVIDTTGKKYINSLVDSLFKQCDAAIFVYAINNFNSFNKIPEYIERCKKNASKDILMVLVGTKLDLKERRIILTEEGKKLAEENEMLFFETSAKTGENVKKLFVESVQKIYEIKKKKTIYHLEIGKEKIKRVEKENKKKGFFSFFC